MKYALPLFIYVKSNFDQHLKLKADHIMYSYAESQKMQINRYTFVSEVTGTKIFSSGTESAMFYIKLQHPGLYTDRVQKTSTIERG